MNDSRIINCD